MRPPTRPDARPADVAAWWVGVAFVLVGAACAVLALVYDAPGLAVVGNVDALVGAVGASTATRRVEVRAYRRRLADLAADAAARAEDPTSDRDPDQEEHRR